MAVNPIEENILRLRFQQLVDSYSDPSLLGDCDCTSYSHILLSIILLSLGIYITIPTFLATPHHIFNNLGQMWLIGPLCICCGIMVAIKSVLYLRKKTVLKMLIRQRALLLLAEEQRYAAQAVTTHTVGNNAQFPPPYELIENRLPTYAEVVRCKKPNECCCPRKSQQSYDYSLNCVLAHAITNSSLLNESLNLQERSTFIAASVAEITDFTVDDNPL